VQLEAPIKMAPWGHFSLVIVAVSALDNHGLMPVASVPPAVTMQTAIPVLMVVAPFDHDCLSRRSGWGGNGKGRKGSEYESDFLHVSPPSLKLTINL
jgi:hypothetical protein